MNLSQKQKYILLGTLLGDGTMELNGRYPRLRIDHSVKQKLYVEWKYNILKNLTTGGIKYFSQKIDARTGKTYKHCKFDTKSTPLLNEFYKMFYSNGNKQVPNNIVRILKNPLSIAVWYMDDGYKRSDCNALRISTNSYSRNEILLLQMALKNNFGIESNQYKQSENQYVIYIPSSQSKKFCKIIKPFMIKYFDYKLI